MSSAITARVSLWRRFKHGETARRFPFMRRAVWCRRFPFRKGRWTQRDALRVHDALLPFRALCELEQASSIVASAAALDREIDVGRIEQLLLELQYLDARQRRIAYANPDGWVHAALSAPSLYW